MQDGPTGTEIGQIVQENVIGKIRFASTPAARVGSINARELAGLELQHPWTTPGIEVARITKTWEGLAKAMFTTADNYVVQIHRPLRRPAAQLVVAAALSRRHRAQAGQPRLN